MENIDASIIIATYNRRDLLELSLHSFNFQDYNKNKFEVILIDDGSTDNTYDMIKSLDANYNLIFLRNEKNRGAAFARNIGLKNAKGDIIIFSDSDCIVPPNFISDHLKYHSTNSKICVSGAIRWKKVFSNYYKNFNTMQLTEFKKAAETIPLFKDRLKCINFNYDDNFKILSKDDVPNIDKYNYIPSWSEEYLGKIIKIFGKGLKNFQYPWILFTTGNVSIEKKYIIDAGYFDQRLRREEDWDLGYRLYKNGVKFIYSPELESTHQEHTIINNREEKMMNSYKMIFNKYKDYELFLFCLFIENTIDISKLSEADAQYKILLQNKYKYSKLIDRFHLLLKYRVNSFLESKIKSDKFMNIGTNFIDTNLKNMDSFTKVFKELSRILY